MLLRKCHLLSAAFLYAAAAAAVDGDDDACSSPGAEPGRRGQCHLQVQQTASAKGSPQLMEMAGKDRSMTCAEACEKLDEKKKEAALLKTSPEGHSIGFNYTCWSTTGGALLQVNKSQTSPTEKCCEAFCVGTCPCMIDEAERCELKSCEGCSYCPGSPTPAPTPAPPTPEPTCGPEDDCCRHPVCVLAGLQGKCCPTTNSEMLNCCDPPPLCIDNPTCTDIGLVGECCPTTSGTFLDCCKGIAPLVSHVIAPR